MAGHSARFLRAIKARTQNAGVEKSTHTPLYDRFRETLVAMRTSADMSQRQLAAALDREHSFVSRIELGERRVDVVEFYWIAQACGADPAKELRKLMRDFAKIDGTS